jgi:hypothetical protein
MITDALKDTCGLTHIFAVPDTRISCTIWDEQLGETLNKIKATFVGETSSECWEFVVDLTTEVMQILIDSKVLFSEKYLGM